MIQLIIYRRLEHSSHFHRSICYPHYYVLKCLCFDVVISIPSEIQVVSICLLIDTNH